MGLDLFIRDRRLRGVVYQQSRGKYPQTEFVRFRSREVSTSVTFDLPVMAFDDRIIGECLLV